MNTQAATRSEERNRRSLRRGRLFAATILTALAVVLLAAVLPESLRFLALVAAFAAGIALERFRHSFFPTPPSLRETPEAWRYLLRYEVGYGQLAIASLLLGAAAAVLLVSFDSGDDSTSAAPMPEIPSAGPSPDVGVRAERPGRPFTAEGVRFEVTGVPPAAAAAQDVAGPGEVVVALAVEIRNLDRRNFNPAALDYRLRDAGGSLFAAARSTAAGSETLVQLGRLPVGDRVDQRLVFAVPQEARGLDLEFEPEPNAASKVRVPVGEAG